MSDHMQQARDTAALVSRLGITGANYAGAARRSDDGALDAARTDFASAVAEVHKALAERDALAARVGAVRAVLDEISGTGFQSLVIDAVKRALASPSAHAEARN